MSNPSVRFAVIAFVFSVAWTAAEHFLGFNSTNHQTGQYTRLVPAFFFYLCVGLAVWQQKKKQGNRLRFGQGLQTGAGVALLYALLVTLWFALYAEVINTDFQPTLMAFERGKLEAEGAPAAAISSKMKEVELTSGGSVLSYIILFGFMAAFGSAIAALVSLFLKRTKNR